MSFAYRSANPLSFGPFASPYDASTDDKLFDDLLNSTLRGEAYSLTPTILPNDASLEVRLLDISISDGPAIMLANTTIVPAQQIPIAFSIPYDRHQILRGRTYSISGTIRAGGKLLYANDCTHLVFTGSSLAQAKLRLTPVG
ncbi:YbaY family lipoprotein [Cohaesibacter celericrescens]|uniref:Lipoprotein n=1 Tax=Cohaesibacter celericrescens TaxID=2067669 RepID=A0A2N5XM29_9HYPH|nr:YbaY family lipoprotein [Cohaesibacter celericrescens]PLW75591.1 hypothetical protein C0081_18225 [Cohaesibacter celericrescens]